MIDGFRFSRRVFFERSGTTSIGLATGMSLLPDWLCARQSPPDESALIRRIADAEVRAGVEAAKYVLSRKTADGLISGSGFYTEAPPRNGCDGVTQCYAVHACRQMAKLCAAAGQKTDGAAWSGDADKLSQSFAEAFWCDDHFYERWELNESPPCPAPPLNDVAAMRRVWYLEATAGKAAGRKPAPGYGKFKKPGIYVATVTGTAGNLSVTQKVEVIVQE